MSTVLRNPPGHRPDGNRAEQGIPTYTMNKLLTDAANRAMRYLDALP